MARQYKNEIPCLEQRKISSVEKVETQLPYLIISNWDIAKAINKYDQDKIDTLGRHMIQMYIHDILIPNMLEVISNVTTKAKLLEKYVPVKICQEKVVEWLINIGFKYNCAINNYFVDVHKNKDMIRYGWKFSDNYILVEHNVFRWIQTTAEESDQYKYYKRENIIPRPR